MLETTNRLQHLFIVRTWREPSTVVASAEWRGMVEHVPSGQRRYFTRLEELDHFILYQMEQSETGEGKAEPGSEA